MSVSFVVIVVTPVIDRAPLCVMVHAVAVAVSAPPTVEAANSIAASLTTVAAPVPVSYTPLTLPTKRIV